MIGNRKAFRQALIAYLCIGGSLGVCLVFYGTNWDKSINLGWIVAVIVIWAIGSLFAILFAWRRAKKGEVVGPIYLHDLFSRKVRRWILGKDDTHSDP